MVSRGQYILGGGVKFILTTSSAWVQTSFLHTDASAHAHTGAPVLCQTLSGTYHTVPRVPLLLTSAHTQANTHMLWISWDVHGRHSQQKRTLKGLWWHYERGIGWGGRADNKEEGRDDTFEFVLSSLHKLYINFSLIISSPPPSLSQTRTNNQILHK